MLTSYFYFRHVRISCYTSLGNGYDLQVSHLVVVLDKNRTTLLFVTGYFAVISKIG